jgi:hypothetical protein
LPLGLPGISSVVLDPKQTRTQQFKDRHHYPPAHCNLVPNSSPGRPAKLSDESAAERRVTIPWNGRFALDCVS